MDNFDKNLTAIKLDEDLRPISEYTIVAGNHDFVVKRVNQRLKEGFELLGGATITADRYKIYYAQVMIKRG